MNQSASPIAIKLHLQRDAFSLQMNVELPAQGITAVFGPSGCGKSTLLRAIAGLENNALDIHQTHISVAGRIWQSPSRNVPVHERRVGFVFQDPSLFDHLSVKGNLVFALKRRQAKCPAGSLINYNDLIQLLDLTPLLDRMPQHLSGGERQRVALGRALLSDPALLLLDEPLAALDQKRKQEILPYLECLQRFLSIPMIYVSHALDELVQLADHLLLMEQGKITAQGSVIDLLSHVDSLAGREDAFNLLEGQVLEACTAHNLTRIGVGDAELLLPRIAVPQNTRLRLRLYARDISFCLEPPRSSSILNILPAQILALDTSTHTPDSGQCLVRLGLAQHQVLARISLYSAAQLQLAPGKWVYAQIKALALMK